MHSLRPGQPPLPADSCPRAAWWESQPSRGGRQLFSCWWNVPLEIVPQGLFSPPTPGRTVINTATNAHDANWQRECNTSRFSNPAGPIAFPSLPPCLVCFRSAVIQLWRFLQHVSGWCLCFGLSSFTRGAGDGPRPAAAPGPAFLWLGEWRTENRRSD